MAGLYRISYKQAAQAGITGPVLYKWSNTFQLNSTNSLNALANAQQIWNSFLRGAVREDTFCYEIYVSSVVEGDVDFITQAPELGTERGLLPPQGFGDRAWRDLALVVSLDVPGSRPDRKFWRPGLREGDFDEQGRFVSPGLVSAVTEAFTNLIATGIIRDSQGNLIQRARVVRVTNRRMGRTSGSELPPAPPVG